MPSDSLVFETRLGSPDLPPDHKLFPVLASALKSRPLAVDASETPLWSASHFGLERLAAYRGATHDEREAILQACCRAVLEEAYYIEKCGMYYSSKMSLLAESTQERMLYSLFAADEASHFRWVAEQLPADCVDDFRQHPFIRLLNQALEDLDKVTLTYVIQIILEGWGLHHYQGLARNCQSPAFAGLLREILRDEARHHASGLILFETKELTPKHEEAITTLLARFFAMIQVGPQAIAGAVIRARGGMTLSAKVRLFEDLDTERESTKRLTLMQSLIRSAAHANKFLPRLEAAGCFIPCSAAHCAELA